MGFITGPRLEIIEEYIKPKKFKGKLVIPIGPQTLTIKSVESKISRAGNAMIVLSITRTEYDGEGKKVPYHSMVNYFTPGRIQELKSFVLTAFNLRLESTTIEGLESETRHLKAAQFECIIYHQKRLVMKDGQPAERRFVKDLDKWGLPIVIYEPKIWKCGPKGVTLELKDTEHILLVQPLPKEEEEIFNLTLKNRYQNFYGTIKD